MLDPEKVKWFNAALNEWWKMNPVPEEVRSDHHIEIGRLLKKIKALADARGLSELAYARMRIKEAVALSKKRTDPYAFAKRGRPC